MKLFYTPTSPFVRKVLVVAHELGLVDRLELVLLRPSPTAADPTLSAHNPLNKIPALVGEDGEALYDSPVICEHLESIAGAARLVPASGPERFRVLRTQALCDGILDAGILVYYEKTQRPRELHWPAWIEGQSTKARQGLDALERAAAAWPTAVDAPVDLGHICAGVTLGWLEFRDAIGDIRTGRPRLTAWYDAFRERPSMKATEPHL
jgi:glutathione S-transferase